MPTKYPQEFKERAVRLVGDRLNHANTPSITAAIKDIAPRLGISHNTLARWCNTAALDTGKEISRDCQVNGVNPQQSSDQPPAATDHQKQ